MGILRINIDGDYLIIAPDLVIKSGYHHMISERGFLVENIINFMKNYPDAGPDCIVIYELREVNLGRQGDKE